MNATVNPEDERLGVGRCLLFGLQHMLTMYGSLIATPLVVGSAAGLAASEVGALITASLFIGGVATLLQSLGLPFFGSRLPLVQGVSFAGVATMIAIINGGGGMSWFQVIFGSGISSAAVLAVVLNLAFNHIRAGTPQDPSVNALGIARRNAARDPEPRN
ncbi:solute carrier family 23 protein [Streptomyces sp. NPDC015127]|uniref:solute carrier family 23 protein n=1 Tax=Streptomyces sp. NPDC015127 TaxID=3364939 RepID=UPI003702C0F2